MALMTGAGVAHRLIDLSGTALLSPNVVVVHTIVGRDPASAAHFSTGGYGEITQSRDTRYRSAACLNGNWRAIAIENEDRYAPFPDWDVNNGHAVPAFTAAQIESIARILVWCHRTHGIPLVFVTDSRPTTRGVTFHRAGCDGNFAGYAFGGRISGGELWSTAYGKVCPGDRRIFQLRDVIIPRARVLAGLSTRGVISTMDWTDQLQVPEAPAGTTKMAATYLTWGSHNIDKTLGKTNEILTALAQLAAKVGELADDEAHILGFLRDPTNPLTAETVNRILAGVTTIVEADQDNEIVIGPEHLEAYVEAVAGALPDHLRPVLGETVARVLVRGTEEYPSTPAG